MAVESTELESSACTYYYLVLYDKLVKPQDNYKLYSLHKELFSCLGAKMHTT